MTSHRHTATTVTLAAHARRGLIKNIFMIAEVEEINAPLKRTIISELYNPLLPFLLGTVIKRPVS